MSTTLKIIRIILFLLSLPGIFVALFSGAVTASLLWGEYFPDPNDIAHGMAMEHGFLPMVVWTILAVFYLLFLRLVWLGIKKFWTAKNQDIKIS